MTLHHPLAGTVLDGPVTHQTLIDEVTRGLATLLLEERGPVGQAFYRIVVERADGHVWEATRHYHVHLREAEQWPDEAANALRGMHQQETRRLQALERERIGDLDQWARERRAPSRLTRAEQDVLDELEADPDAPARATRLCARIQGALAEARRNS